jgi:hypothetical protein
MLTRFASRYLWFSPLAFIVLLPLYHGVGFWAGAAGGVIHLALVAWGMHANHAFTAKDDTAGFLLGAMLLIAGGAEVWATGASGPPSAAHPNVALFNQAGLTLGFFISLLGFAAMAPTLVSNRGRAMAAVGLSCFFLMCVIWVIGTALGIPMRQAPLVAQTPAQQPEVFQILRSFRDLLLPAIAVGGYLGGAMLSEVSIHSGWVGRRAGRLMSIYCVIGMFALPLSQFLFFPVGSSVSEVPRMVWILAPFLPPAMMCLVPYYVGVLGLRQAAGTAARPGRTTVKDS